MENKPTHLYRYEEGFSSSGEFIPITHCDIRCYIYTIIKHTPQGYWIEDFHKKTWVSAHSKKRFAYPTKEEAREAFIYRKKSHFRHLKSKYDRILGLLKYLDPKECDKPSFTEVSIMDFNERDIKEPGKLF